VAELGQRALAGVALDTLVAEAAESAARERGPEFAAGREAALSPPARTSCPATRSITTGR
jgi:hypothetical protein